jgi:hypothetical protein
MPRLLRTEYRQHIGLSLAGNVFDDQENNNPKCRHLARV